MCGVGLEDGVGGKEFERRQCRETWGPKYISSAASNVCLTALTLKKASSKLLYTYDNGKVKKEHIIVFDLDSYPQWRMW